MRSKVTRWVGVLTLVLLSTFAMVFSIEVNKDPCDVRGAGCYRTYQAGRNDCYGSPSNCYRETVCP